MDDKFTLADVFEEGFEAYVARFGPLPAEQYKVAHAIMNCRTPLLGGNIYRCDGCGHEMTLYNSCRNRHCPTCQAYARVQWVQKRLDDLLPVPYYHAVFTIPEQLRDIALRNRKVVYAILFRSVKEVLTELGANPKRLGAIVGFISVLHTWTQTLEYHPHIHVVIPGGGLSPQRTAWVGAREDFLLPVPVMRSLFRGKMLAYLKEALSKGDICLEGKLRALQNPAILSELFDSLYRREWVVYIKPPFGSAREVIKYLGGYTHRVAISNRRIENVAEGKVTFSYKDRRDGNRIKQMTLDVVEFIRRFMTHLVPEHFCRMRHCGFLSNRNRNELLPLCRELLEKGKGSEEHRTQELFESLVGIDPCRCPQCKKAKMHIIEQVAPILLRAA